MTATFPDTEVQRDDGTASELLLLELREEVRRQGESMRATQRAFSIFALLALLLAGATLLAVAFKLDSKSKTAGVSVKASTPAVTQVTSTPAVPAAAPAPAPALGHKVGVSLREFSVNPTVTAAAAGKVTFTVHNTGSITHEFVVLRTAKSAGSLLNGARADEAGNVAETGDLKAGAAKTVTVNLKPGHYALICNLPGHYSAGQHTDFTVR
jgi:uncharacterized cupredoxin-like copper-binding protein